MSFWRNSSRARRLLPTYGLLLAMLWVLPLAAQEESVIGEALDAQQAQTALQERIDATDETTREMLEELRRLEKDTQQLERQNSQLAARLVEQAQSQQQREAALSTLAQTRQALPGFEREIAAQLQRWVEQDLPFLQDQRLARAASLQPDGTAIFSSAERIERLLEAWRTELEYGREVDAWRGRIVSEEGGAREVDYLRIGRVGLYYLTPSGRQGGVWQAESGRWEALSDSQRSQVREGLRLARDQRAPELLTLPISQPLTAPETSA
ncbi:DUF3450 domain-containing protein [Vreelandella zhuhanensis]|nr:DUF3450 domain-containing protein [Halomonas zhuhanensis]